MKLSDEFVTVLDFSGKAAIMSRTVAFGTEALGSGEDLEELLAALTGDEVTALVDEMASDPDDVHLPASVRNSYRCAKARTN